MWCGVRLDHRFGAVARLAPGNQTHRRVDYCDNCRLCVDRRTAVDCRSLAAGLAQLGVHTHHQWEDALACARGTRVAHCVVVARRDNIGAVWYRFGYCAMARASRTRRSCGVVDCALYTRLGVGGGSERDANGSVDGLGVMGSSSPSRRRRLGVVASAFSTDIRLKGIAVL